MMPNEGSIWAANPKLKGLLFVLMVVLLVSGIGLSVLSLKQTQYRQQIYEQTQAALPEHQTKGVDNTPKLTPTPSGAGQAK